MTREDYQALIPQHTFHDLQEYLTNHTPPGDFLRAVLENDLRRSFGKADLENRRSLFYLVTYLHNWAPHTCWGSPHNVTKWLEPTPCPACPNCGWHKMTRTITGFSCSRCRNTLTLEGGT